MVLAVIELTKSIDLDTLAMIILALLLAISGFAQRAGRPADPGALPLVCPNKIDELWPKLRELVRRVEEAGRDQEEGRRLCGELRLLMERIEIQIGGEKDLSAQKLATILAAIERVERSITE